MLTPRKRWAFVAYVALWLTQSGCIKLSNLAGGSTANYGSANFLVTVTDASGNPIANSRVTALQSLAPDIEVTTDDKGVAALTLTADATIVVNKELFDQQVLQVTAPTTPGSATVKLPSNPNSDGLIMAEDPDQDVPASSGTTFVH